MLTFVCAMLALAQDAKPWTLDASKRLTVETHWLGNSFGGGPKWVQNFAQGLFVHPDGTAYVPSIWDEAGREFGFYRDGDTVGKADETHGWGTGGGLAIAASDRYVFVGHAQGNEGGGLTGAPYPPKGKLWYGITRYTRDGKVAPFAGGRGRFGALLIVSESPDGPDHHLRSMAYCRGQVVTVSPATGELLFVDPETMSIVKREPAADAFRLTTDPKGDLWLLRENGWRLERHGGFAAPLPRSIAKPTGFAFAPNGEIWVSDSGPDQDVKVLDPTGRRVVRTFGVKGGTEAGPRPGATGPLRFSNPTGVGFDAKGNVTIACNQAGGGTVLRSFDPKGKLRWELLGLEFVDAADANPGSDGSDIYTTGNRYTFDPSKPAGKSWRWRAQTVAPFRYPDDFRGHSSNHLQTGPQIRVFGGHRYLCVRGMWQNHLCLYRLDGELAIPVASLNAAVMRSGAWSPPGQPGSGAFFWLDQDGDGRIEAGEYVPTPGPQGEFWASNVDDRGGIWQASQDGLIYHWPLVRVTPKGVPIYEAIKEPRRAPAEVNHLLRTDYDAATDTMYLYGHSALRPKTGGEWGSAGAEVFRYDRWSTQPTLRWRAGLPYDSDSKQARIITASQCMAGDYIFAVEVFSARVHVYAKQTGAYVGWFGPGPEVHGESGWVDFRDAIRAVRRTNGEYLIFVEEDAKAKVLIYRWRPSVAR